MYHFLLFSVECCQRRSNGIALDAISNDKEVICDYTREKQCASTKSRFGGRFEFSTQTFARNLVEFAREFNLF